MKAGIYLALTALRDLGRRRLTALPVDFLVVPDEETGSHASRPHIEPLPATRATAWCASLPAPTAASASPRARAPACCAWA